MTPDRRTVVSGLLVALALGATLRGLWLTSDPPTHGAVGIVWHDEGAGVHNARNRVLWGVWRTDAWNPVYIAPVFTAARVRRLSSRSASARGRRASCHFRIGTPLAVAALGIGLAGGRRAPAALCGGAVLLSTNYVFVMWNRAALMESTMTACIVGAWACYAVAVSRPMVGIAAGVMATLAWFSKAAAAFFVAAITLDALGNSSLARSTRVQSALRLPAPSATARSGSTGDLVGAWPPAPLVIVALSRPPHWADYRFYNWQMSVTRKPSYTLQCNRRPCVVASVCPGIPDTDVAVGRRGGARHGRRCRSLAERIAARAAARPLVAGRISGAGGTRRRQRAPLRHARSGVDSALDVAGRAQEWRACLAAIPKPVAGAAAGNVLRVSRRWHRLYESCGSRMFSQGT